MHTAETSGPTAPAAQHGRARRATTCIALATTAAALAAALGTPGAARASAPTESAAAPQAPQAPQADLVCQVFVEQDNLASPLNKDGNTTSANEIKGATVGCSSPDGRFAPGNRGRNPVLRSSNYTSVGGPSVNNVTEIGHDCTTLTQTATLQFTWNTGDTSVGRITFAADGTTTSRVLRGLMAGDSFTLSGPAVDDVDSYLTYLGSCSTTDTGGELDGFVVNSWLPGRTGSTGHEIGLAFTRG